MNSPLVYELCHPAKVDPEKNYPALFLMHGMGSNEQDLLGLVKGIEEQFYIFSIRGPLSQPPGFAFFTIEGFGKPHREVFDQVVSRLTSFIEQSIAQFPIDKSRLYLMGFSQGAILSMTLGVTLGNQIKGIIALSGYIPQFVKEEYNIQPVDDLSIFISHGELDNVLPFVWGQENNEYFKKLGANVSFHSYKEGHTVSLENYRDFRQWLHENL